MTLIAAGVVAANTPTGQVNLSNVFAVFLLAPCRPCSGSQGRMIYWFSHQFPAELTICHRHCSANLCKGLDAVLNLSKPKSLEPCRTALVSAVLLAAATAGFRSCLNHFGSSGLRRARRAHGDGAALKSRLLLVIYPRLFHFVALVDFADPKPIITAAFQFAFLGSMTPHNIAGR
jgi:hypothetical protein